MKIVGIAGKKQSGKNTTANILHGIVLKKQNLIKDFNIGNDGKLIILTEDSHGKEGWGEFDIARKDSDFAEYAERSMWPYIKLYSFADNLKQICVELFDMPHECVWGTNEQKNQKVPHLLWENLPSGTFTKRGPMTAREFMQYLGTDMMRRIYEPVWVQSCIKKIKHEQSGLAVVADVRFPNEVDTIANAGGVTVRLTRKARKDEHPSEIALDDYDFTHYIDNKSSIDALVGQVKSFYHKL